MYIFATKVKKKKPIGSLEQVIIPINRKRLHDLPKHPLLFLLLVYKFNKSFTNFPWFQSPSVHQSSISFQNLTKTLSRFLRSRTFLILSQSTFYISRINFYNQTVWFSLVCVGVWSNQNGRQEECKRSKRSWFEGKESVRTSGSERAVGWQLEYHRWHQSPRCCSHYQILDG